MIAAKVPEKIPERPWLRNILEQVSQIRLLLKLLQVLKTVVAVPEACHQRQHELHRIVGRVARSLRNTGLQFLVLGTIDKRIDQRAQSRSCSQLLVGEDDLEFTWPP